MFNTSWRFFIRSVIQNRAYSLLSVLGLAVGLAVTLLVVLYLRNELTYDKHHPDSERIWRLTSKFYFDTEKHHFALSGLGLAPILNDESDIIEEYVRIGSAGKNVLLKHGEQAYYEDEIFYADSTYFKLFPSEFVEGDPRTALKGKNNMVLTESLATEIFGSGNAMGKVLRTNNNRFTVSAVIKDLPQNNHIQFKALLPAFLDQLEHDELIRSLWAGSTYTYVKLREGKDERDIQEAFQSVHDKYMASVARAIDSDYDIIPEPLEDIHYSSVAEFDMPRGKRGYLFVFSGVGILILAMAMINYVNLATARAASRAKEIGVRKVLGSTRGDLIRQLLVESVIFTFVALFLAVIIVELLLQTPLPDLVIQKQLSINILSEPWLIYAGILIALLVGVLSGLYPALYLSKIRTANALKGGFKSGSRSRQLRRFLVGLQFTISVSVVVLALLMTHQMEFMSDRYLGFNKEDIILVPVQDTSLREVIPLMLDELREQPNVIAASAAHSAPGSALGRMLMIARESVREGASRDAVDYMNVGGDYFETMEMAFVAGGSFRPELHSDTSQTVVVNETLVKYYGWDDPIGQVLEWGLRETGGAYNTVTIVGVVKDFNASSLHRKVEPMVIFMEEEGMGTLHLRVNSTRLKVALREIERVWNEYNTGRPFEFSFLDNELNDLYSEDRKQARLIAMLTLVTILISTLGLVGLASYTTQQRYKEIGVRKVLGASLQQILQLLFKDVAVLVSGAVLMSIPLSWMVFRTWVDGFAYLAPINWYGILLTGVLAVTFAYLVVSLHSLKAARTNPMKSLRYE